MPSLDQKILPHSISALILAAGKGTRMKSSVPKVLHPVMGRSILEWVITTVKKAGAVDITVVLSNDTTPFEPIINKYSGIRLATQKNPRGTGDAVASAASSYRQAKAPSWCESTPPSGPVSEAQWVLICAGDTPGINPSTLQLLIDQTLASGRPLAVLGMNLANPRGYGRLIKNTDKTLQRIVEERDATPDIQKLKLCNTGVMMARVDWLFELLEVVSPSNAQNEYYITDVFHLSEQRGQGALIVEAPNGDEFEGINDRLQLRQMEDRMLKARMEELMSHGVTIHRPETCYIEPDVTIESDTRIMPGACLKGLTRIGRNCVIGPHSVIDHSTIGGGVDIGAHAVLTRVRVPAGEKVPPQSVMADLDL